MSIQSEINRIAGAKSDIADAIEDQGVTVPSGTKLDGRANLIGQISGESGKLNSTQAADAYDQTATYAVGDKVSYAGNVYSCISAISTPEAWDSTHWDQVDPIQDQVDEVRNTLNQLDAEKADEASLALRRSGATNTGTQIEKGTFFYLDGTPKRAIATIAQNASFTAQNCETVTDGGLNLLNSGLTALDSSALKYRGALANTDINTIKGESAQGVYSVGGNNSNIPNAANWSVMFVLYSFGGTHQLIYNANALLIRSYTGAPLAWTAWKEATLKTLS